MYLTREQAAAGDPCRGCGLPAIDNLGNWPGTMYLTPEQKIEYDADQAKYKEMHPDCDAHRRISRHPLRLLPPADSDVP